MDWVVRDGIEMVDERSREDVSRRISFALAAS
jgi:hypothetical protein